MIKRKVSEETIQALLMLNLMGEWHHRYVLPNSNTFFAQFWESDIISITNTRFAHEFEIKLNRADYRRDYKKSKIRWLEAENRTGQRIPNYFWYVTFEFEIEPPDFAGWILVQRKKEYRYEWEHGHWLSYAIKKKAPRLHRDKLPDAAILLLAHLLSQRLANHYYKEKYEEIIYKEARLF